MIQSQQNSLKARSWLCRLLDSQCRQKILRQDRISSFITGVCQSSLSIETLMTNNHHKHPLSGNPLSSLMLATSLISHVVVLNRGSSVVSRPECLATSLLIHTYAVMLLATSLPLHHFDTSWLATSYVPSAHARMEGCDTDSPFDRRKGLYVN